MKATGNTVLRRQERLRLKENSEHEPDTYDDLQLDFNPLLFTSLERYLPNSLLHLSRDSKIHFMHDILSRYSPHSERIRIQKHREYRQRIISMYPPRNRGIYTMRPLSFFVPSFLKAVNDNTEESFRSIMMEPVPGVYTFDMLQPSFCEVLMSEVENFERWVHDVKFRIMRPNTMNKYGVVLDDFGFENMLEEMMDGYVRPMSQILFPEVGGLTLDSHHGFVVEYGTDRDSELGFHVDDSEVTLNVCLGKQFYGGELFFRGVRCDKHVNTETQTEEVLDYAHVPGRAILHRGRHRHGARPTFSGNRMNLILWCRSEGFKTEKVISSYFVIQESSVFREMKKYQKDCSSWCAECWREKKERQRLSIAATKLELLKRDGISAS